MPASAKAQTPPRARAATTKTPPKGPPAVTQWSSLLETATVEDKSAKRPGVDVPSEVLDFARALQASGKVATINVRDQKHFDEVKLVFQSAADKLDNASAIVRPVKEEFTVDDDGEEVTGSRIVGAKISMGIRRGAKS
jgi:hypothetical protein